MFRKVSNTLDSIYKLGGLGAGILLILLCLLVLYSIIARPLGLFAGGATDFAGYVMATSTFLALSYTFRSNGHIRVSLLIQNFTGSARRGIETFCVGFMTLITAYIAFYMTRLAVDSFEFGERSEGADAVLLWIPQTPVAVGSILLFISVLHTLLQSLFDYDAINPELGKDEGPNEI